MVVMTLRELIEACQYTIVEVTEAFFTPEAWRGYLNAAQNEFARKTGCIERISQGRTVPGRRVYPRDLDFFHINLVRSEEHTSELQSRENIVCRLHLEKKNL